MFEDSKLLEVGDLINDPDRDGKRGIRLKTREDRIITVRGLTVEECRIISKFWGQVLILDLRAP